MANITITVQSILNSATTLSITIDNASLVSALKTAINAQNGTPVAIIDLYFNGVNLVNTNTLASYNIITNSFITASNNISNSSLWTKQQRQEYKLQLAQLRRKAGGDSTKPFYRINNTFNIDLLPTKYTGDTVTDNVAPLQLSRPWIP